MERFPVFYFQYETRYPEGGSRMNLGRSYLYTTEPLGPDQRRFVLTLQGMQYFLDENDQPDYATEYGRNMWQLEAFYTRHRLHREFELEHPLYGLVDCKFHRPLTTPKGIPGGNGLLPEFEVELIEIPT